MTTLDAPLPAPHEDADDAAVRYAALVKKSIKQARKRFTALADKHGGGTVALANMGARGVRMLFIANDGVFGDVVVPNAAAAQQVCEEGNWEISGWDSATVKRISPSAADRRRMVGTGR